MTRGSLVEAAARARELDRLEQLALSAKRQDGEAYRPRTRPQKKYKRKRNHKRERELEKKRAAGAGLSLAMEAA